MENLTYIVEDSTIAEVLGVQNFTNEESAILELVKNAYDAQASSIEIIISKEKIIIQDNGIGMNRDSILNLWMHVGKSEKKYIVGNGGDARVLAGSKGVGRFAIARLGARASVYSKMKNEQGVLWKTDWNTSTLDEQNDIEISGTQIIIESLRDDWTKSRVIKLHEFLSRTYDDDKMKIFIEYQGEKIEVKKYFRDVRLGVNCVTIIKLNYYSNLQKLVCDIESDEFKEEAKKYCSAIDLKKKTIELNISEELREIRQDFSEDKSEEDWKAFLENIGDFNAELYFSLKKSSFYDTERFFYKYTFVEDRFNSGVVLYRNAFSISSYEGNKDWLGFGKRSRLSPAAATHPTGSWRVRENQISGKVVIDKKNNKELQDLMNRQGLVENDYYKIFIKIINSGISCFERYRQSIIRSLSKNNKPKSNLENKMIERIIKDPNKLSDLSSQESILFVDELKQIKEENKERKRQIEETENRYKYDIRLLNMLATSGLKATSIAHELHNERNSINCNVENIVSALKRYGLWEIVNNSENTKYAHRNIPELLEKNIKINNKIISFMDQLLKELEKNQFIPEKLNLEDIFLEIKKSWEKDYGWIQISFEIEGGGEFKSAKDIFFVIFDNLILNSIQQNDERSLLNIKIKLRKKGRYIDIEYYDDGKGLSQKYIEDPMRILEVHETSRENGHGIGMWIVNNTIIGTGGNIKKIEGINGFELNFEIGSKV